MTTNLVDELAGALQSIGQEFEILADALVKAGTTNTRPISKGRYSITRCMQIIRSLQMSDGTDDSAALWPGDLPTPMEMLPAEVIRAVNDSIRTHWTGVSATVPKLEIEQDIAQLHRNIGSTPPSTLSWHPKIEPAYRSLGWVVSWCGGDSVAGTPGYWEFSKP